MREEETPCSPPPRQDLPGWTEHKPAQRTACFSLLLSDSNPSPSASQENHLKEGRKGLIKRRWTAKGSRRQGAIRTEF